MTTRYVSTSLMKTTRLKALNSPAVMTTSASKTITFMYTDLNILSVLSERLVVFNSGLAQTVALSRLSF